MKLTILGSGSPEPSQRRASSGYLVEIGADKILFDVGGGVFGNLLRAGLRPGDITHIVFTHYHTDHMIDYPRLLHAAWDERADPPKVYGPPPLIEIHNRFFGPEGALAFDLRARTELPPSQQVWVDRGGTLPRPWPTAELTEISAGEVISGDGWTIRSARATHAEPFLTCYGYALEAMGKKLVYSGDTGLNPEIETLCRDADFLLHWCYRAPDEALHPALLYTCPDPAEIAAMATRAGAKRLWITHFRSHMDTVGIYDAALSAMQNAFAGDVGIVEDLQVFAV